MHHSGQKAWNSLFFCGEGVQHAQRVVSPMRLTLMMIVLRGAKCLCLLHGKLVAKHVETSLFWCENRGLQEFPTTSDNLAT